MLDTDFVTTHDCAAVALIWQKAPIFGLGSRFDSGLSKAALVPKRNCEAAFESLRVRWKMDQGSRLAVYQAQVDNLRELTTADRQLRRSINDSLRRNDQVGLRVATKVRALLFCAWAECNFSKMIHTPHGLDLADIEVIKRVVANEGIAAGWKKCLEIALSYSQGHNSGFLANAEQKLSRIVDRFVTEPALLRNKIAHGQWFHALNRENTAVNPVKPRYYYLMQERELEFAMPGLSLQ